MNKILVIFLISFLSSEIHSQNETTRPFIDRNEIPGSKITQTRAFNGKSLYGYIDGGADLYLEYGFKSVVITDLLLEKRKYKVEVYEMTDPEASFGIFSVSRFKCLSRPVFTTHSCLNRYQLQFCRGKYYVSIINESGVPADTTVSLRIASLIGKKIPGENIDFESFIKESDLIFHPERFVLVRGRLGLINGFPALEDYFKDINGFTALLQKGDTTIVSVIFDSSQVMKKFCDINGIILPDIINASVEGNGQKVIKISEKHLYIEKYFP